MSKYIQVAQKSEIANGSAKRVEIEGKSIAVFNLGNEFFAIDDTCPHAGGPLSEGVVEGDEVECPWHGARFKIRSGAVTAPPSDEGVSKYNVRVTGEVIELEV